MLLRSVMRHLRDQNWFAVGHDFLVERADRLAEAIRSELDR